MVLSLLLLAQSVNPYEALKDTIAQSVAKQRESARRQAAVVHGTSTMETSFFTVPWPRVSANTATVASTGPICGPVAPDLLMPMISGAASRHGLPERLIQTVIRKESAGRPCAVSSAGAMGLMQLMPATAQTLGVADPFDPAQNVEAGSRYLKNLLGRFDGDLSLALGAYNAGPHRIEQYRGLPPFAETQNYVGDIVRILSSSGSSGEITRAEGGQE